MTPFEFSVELVEKDYIALNQAVMEKSMKQNRSYRIIKAIGALFIVLGLIPVFYDLSYLILGLPLVLLGLFYSFGMTWLVRVSLKKNVKRLLKQGRTDTLLGNFNYFLTDEALERRSVNGFEGSYWHSFDRLEETEEYLFLFNSSISGYIIPKRELTESEFEECFNLVEKYFSEATQNKDDPQEA